MIYLNDEKNAWKQFAEHGRIEDYLTYRSIQQKTATQGQEDTDNAAEHRWLDHQNTEYR